MSLPDDQEGRAMQHASLVDQPHQGETLPDAATVVRVDRDEYERLVADAHRWRTHADEKGLCPFRSAAEWRRDIGQYLWKHHAELSAFVETPATRDMLREMYLRWSESEDLKSASAAIASMEPWGSVAEWPEILRRRGDTMPRGENNPLDEQFPRPRVFTEEEQRRASRLLDAAFGALDATEDPDTGE